MTRPRKVAILGGGGVMGQGMALACLQGSDVEVTIISRREETVQQGLKLIAEGPFGLARGVEKGRLTETQAADARSRLTGTTRYEEGLAGSDLIFETVPELVEVKQEVLREAERHSPGAVLATNTSSILIAELAALLDDPSRLVGAHWFYPANVRPLVEVARSAFVGDDSVEDVVGYLRRIGKLPVVVKDSPGFFMTRFINTFLAEAIRLVELGVAGPAEIDEMVKTGLGWPIGVFELLDASSFDAFYHAQQYLHKTLGERYTVPALARQAFKAGYLGDPKVKPGSRGGWYEFLGVAHREESS